MAETAEPPKLTRQETARLYLLEAVEQDLQRDPANGIWELDARAYNLIQKKSGEDPEQWAQAQAYAMLELVRGLYQRRVQQKIKTEARADARQGLLALPGFERVSPWVKVEGLISPLNKVTVQQHRDSVKERETRIKRMEYPRWSDERMKREKQALVQERKLDRKVAPVTAGDSEMEMGKAMELYQARLETPKARSNRKKAKMAIQSRWDREKGRT